MGQLTKQFVTDQHDALGRGRCQGFSQWELQQLCYGWLEREGLRAQIAAKDAEIAEFREKADKWRGFVEVMGDQVNDVIAKLESAESDNRALREEVRTLRPDFPRLSVAAQEAAYRAGTKAIKADRDEARECAGSLFPFVREYESMLHNGHETPESLAELRKVREALAATPEHLRNA